MSEQYPDLGITESQDGDYWDIVIPDLDYATSYDLQVGWIYSDKTKEPSELSDRFTFTTPQADGLLAPQFRVQDLDAVASQLYVTWSGKASNGLDYLDSVLKQVNIWIKGGDFGEEYVQYAGFFTQAGTIQISATKVTEYCVKLQAESKLGALSPFSPEHCITLLKQPKPVYDVRHEWDAAGNLSIYWKFDATAKDATGDNTQADSFAVQLLDSINDVDATWWTSVEKDKVPPLEQKITISANQLQKVFGQFTAYEIPYDVFIYVRDKNLQTSLVVGYLLAQYTDPLTPPVITATTAPMAYQVAYTSNSTFDQIYVEESLDSGTTWTLVAVSPANPVLISTLNTLARSVRARFSKKLGGFTAYSNTVSVTPTKIDPTDTTPPSVPSITSGTATYNRIPVTITTSDDTTKGFRLRYKPSAESLYFTDIVIYSGPSTSYTIQDLDSSTTYDISVAAYDGANNLSAYSSTINATTSTTVVPVVSNIILSSLAYGIYGSWTAPLNPTVAINNYKIELYNSLNVLLQTAYSFSTNVSFTGLKSATTYYIKVNAIDITGNSGAQTTSSSITLNASGATTDGLPPTLSPLPVVNPIFNSFEIKWTAVSNADPVTYNVHISPTINFTPSSANLALQTTGTFALIRTLPGTSTALAYGTTYYIKIIASDFDGSAASSAQVSAQTAQLATTDITSGAITSTLIAANTILGSNIANQAITGSLIAPSTITAGNIVNNTITSTQIANNTITSGQIAANTITASQIASGTITANEIAAATITTNKIAANAITSDLIAANTIVAGDIAANTITSSQIAANTITASNIASNTITASQIASETITANQIASDAITSNKIIAGAITADKVNSSELLVDKLFTVGGKRATVSGAAVSGGNIVYTTSGAHGYTALSLVNVTGLSPTAFNITGLQITSVTTNTFTVTNTVSATGSSTGAGTSVAIGKNAIKIDSSTDGVTNPFKFYSGTGAYSNANTPFYLDTEGRFSLTDKLYFSGNTLTVNGTINASAGNIAGALTVNNGTMKIGANVNSTFDGIYINANNYWYSSGNFKIGGAAQNASWDGTTFKVTGEINAASGTITGNLNVTTGSIIAGTVGGPRVQVNSSGLFAYGNLLVSGSPVLTETTQIIGNAATDAPTLITTRALIGNWSVQTDKITGGGLTLNSSGSIIGTSGGSYIGIKPRQSLGTDIVLWAGNTNSPAINSASSGQAGFQVNANGQMYATGAIITGVVSLESGSSLGGLLNDTSKVYYSATTPTAPATGFKTGDSWVDTANGNQLKIWNGTAWVIAQDSESARTIANLKNKTTFGSTQPTSAVAGDIWFDTTVGVNFFKVYNGTSWTRMKDSDITAAQSAAAAAQSTADTKAQTTFSATAPVNPRSGDIWFDTSLGYFKRYNGTSFDRMKDSEITAAQNAALAAQGDATSALNKTIKFGVDGSLVSNLITKLNDGGAIYSSYVQGATTFAKNSYSSTTPGFFIGWENQAGVIYPAFNIGNDAAYVKYSNYTQTLEVKGAIKATSGSFDGNVTAGAGAITIGPSGISTTSGKFSIDTSGNAYFGGTLQAGTILSNGTISGSTITGSTVTTTGTGFGKIKLNSSNNTLEFLTDTDAVGGAMYQFNGGNELIIQHGNKTVFGYPASSHYISINSVGVSLGRTNSSGASIGGLTINSSDAIFNSVNVQTYQGAPIGTSNYYMRNIGMGTGAKLITDTDGIRGDIWIQYT